MNRKKATVLIDLSTLGAFKDLPPDADADTKAAINAHNMSVRAYRLFEASQIAHQAEALGFLVHIGAHGVLLRGLEARLTDISVPASVTCRDASERWNPRPN